MRLFGTYKKRLLLDCKTCQRVLNWIGDHGSHVMCKVCPATSGHLDKVGRQQWKQNHVHETAEESARREARQAEHRQSRIDSKLRAVLWQSNPTLAAEVARGDRRRAQHRGEDYPEETQYHEPEETEPSPLHAHEITPNDAALIRMMAGANFGDEARVTLPSGKTITGAEMRRWVESQVD